MTSRRAASRLPTNLRWQVSPVGVEPPPPTTQSLFYQVFCCRSLFCSPAHQELAPFPYVTHVAKQESNTLNHAGNLKSLKLHRQKQASCARQKGLCGVFLFCFFCRFFPYLSRLRPPPELKFKVMFQYVNCEPATLHLHENPAA